MASTKRFDGDLTIETTAVNGGSTTLTLLSDQIVISGDLAVRGTTTSFETVNSTIQDNTITLNSGFTGITGSSFVGLTSGIEVNRGTRPTVGIRWSEDNGRWELSADGTNWRGIAVDPVLHRVEDDTDPHLGGDLNTNGFSILLKALSTPPAYQAGKTVLYAVDQVGTGGTAIKFISRSGLTSVTDELISRKKSIVYSLIF